MKKIMEISSHKVTKDEKWRLLNGVCFQLCTSGPFPRYASWRVWFQISVQFSDFISVLQLFQGASVHNTRVSTVEWNVPCREKDWECWELFAAKFFIFQIVLNIFGSMFQDSIQHTPALFLWSYWLWQCKASQLVEDHSLLLILPKQPISLGNIDKMTSIAWEKCFNILQNLDFGLKLDESTLSNNEWRMKWQRKTLCFINFH